MTLDKLVIECEKVTEWVALLAKKKYVFKYIAYDSRWSNDQCANPNFQTLYKNMGNQRGFTKQHQECLRRVTKEIFETKELNRKKIYEKIVLEAFKLMRDWIEHHNANKIDVSMFLSSSQVEDNYSEGFYKKEKIEEYNKRDDIDEEIVVGSRLFFLYACPREKEVEWPKKVNCYFTIYNSSDIYNQDSRLRVMYEVYCKKFIRSLTTVFFSDNVQANEKSIYNNVIANLVKRKLLPLK